MVTLNGSKMKKLSKLFINPEKLMKDEELVNLRRGYDGCYTCYITWWDWSTETDLACNCYTPTDCENQILRLHEGAILLPVNNVWMSHLKTNQMAHVVKY